MIFLWFLWMNDDYKTLRFIHFNCLHCLKLCQQWERRQNLFNYFWNQMENGSQNWKRILTSKWQYFFCMQVYAMKPRAILYSNIFFIILSSRADISWRIGLQKPKCLANPKYLLMKFANSMKNWKKSQLWSQNFDIFHY